MTTYKGFDVLELDPNWKEVVQTEHSRGRIVWLPGQYTGLSERNGIAAPPSQAHRDDAGVEVRRLSVYDELIEVASNG